MNKYNIPVRYMEGTYNISDIESTGESITVKDIGFDRILYTTPKYNVEVCIYQTTIEYFVKNAKATYDADGLIKHIDMLRNNRNELIYINFPDNESAKFTVFQFAGFQGEKLAEALLEKHKEKLCRLFVEYFYDGVAVDFAVRTGTPDDMKKITAVDNCGDYPFENRMTPDLKTLEIMLLCADEAFAYELYGFSVYLMTEKIKSVIDRLNKTEDFKFIAEEYD